MPLSEEQKKAELKRAAQADFEAAFREQAGADQKVEDGTAAAEAAAGGASTAEAGGSAAAAGTGEGLNLEAATAENNGAAAANGEAAASAAAGAEGNGADAAAAGGGQAAEGAEGGGSGDAEKQMARLKSWEGRLKKMARDKGLPEDPDDPVYAEDGSSAAGNGNAQKGAEALEDVADQAQANGNGQMAQAAEDLAEKVERAKITPEEARKILAEDFGDQFLELLDIVARDASGKHANEQMESHLKSTSDDIALLKNAAQRNHYRTILREHKDFAEVVDTPEFKAFVAEDPARQAVVESGDAWEAIDLLNDFKASHQTIDPNTQSNEAAGRAAAEIDDAEAVQATGGMRLPAEPEKDISFETAWQEA